MIPAGLGLVVLSSMGGAAAEIELTAPRLSAPIHFAVPAPAKTTGTVVFGDDAFVSELEAGISNSGESDWAKRVLVGTIPAAGSGSGTQTFKGSVSTAPPAWKFSFRPVSDNSLGLWEGESPVFVYNHGTMSKAGVPPDRNRSTYLHPIHGLDGEVLTDDFPKDHYHHRGLFWAWPHVRLGTNHHDLWAISGIHQRFEEWLMRKPGAASALLGVENGWYVGAEKEVQERVWIRVYPASAGQRVMDVDLYLIPLKKPLTLWGAEGKSYGGLTLRFAPNKGTVITIPSGPAKEDLHITKLPWADYSGEFPKGPAGMALFIHPQHPDYPPEWLTRHYGALCIGWPGVEAKTFEPGKPIHLRYRVLVHRKTGEAKVINQIYDAYKEATKVRVEMR